MTARRPPLPALLRWPGLALAALVAIAYRLSEGNAAALFRSDARRAIADFARGFWPPAHSPEFLSFLVRPLLETVAIAFLGLGLAVLVALPLSFLAAAPGLVAAPGRPPSALRRLAWAASRTVLNVMRSVPEIVWALVLVRAVGMGPAAGVAAIGIGYGGILGKVFAEIFEATPRPPADALAAAGATPLRAFAFATVPSALPVLTSYTLYRFDCALRASAVLGLVGAGGIGVQLDLSLKMFAYDEVATIVLALFALVASVDAASQLVRGRLRDSRGFLPRGPGALRLAVAGAAALAAALGAAAAFLRLPIADLLSLAPLRSLAAFWAGSFPPDLGPSFLRRIGPAALETLAVSILGTALAAALGIALAYPAAARAHLLAGGPAVPRARRIASSAVAYAARGLLDLSRTLPELLWALLLIFAVGLGPFAGALALGIHNAGVLGRLYAEALEEVPAAPFAALRAAGASEGAASAFAVLPAAFPQLAAYTLYRWEVNVRASAVLGVVGAGGIGKLLYVSLGLFHVHRTLTLVLVVVAMVTAVDLVSGVLRRLVLAPAEVGAPTTPSSRSQPMAVPLLAAALVLALPSLARAAELRVSAIPDESPTELQRKFAPLGAYLEKAIGEKVTFVPVTDYAGTVEGLAAGKLDLVWYGGFTFVQARRRTGTAIPLVQREEDAHFHSKFIVPAGSKARTLQDLKGASFAFGSVSSTSGHLMPRYWLLKNGIDPEKDFAKVAFSGAHDVTAKWVEAGKVDGGALNESIWQRLLDEKKIDPAKVRVLWTTPDFQDYNWTVRGDLDPKVVEKLRAAFLALDYARPEHRAILDLQRTKRFIPTAPENYRTIEEAARSAGLLDK